MKKKWKLSLSARGVWWAHSSRAAEEVATQRP